MAEEVQGQADEAAESSEATIAVHWREEGYYMPPPKFIGQANASDPAIRARFSEENFPECFREYADLLHWDEYWDTTLDTSNAPFWRWFVGGKLNASYNCVDRHLEQHRNKAALIWVPEPEDVPPVSITYQELYRRVNEFAALLRDFGGVKAGRPGHPAHADGARTPGRDAGLRPARGDPLPGVRRVQRGGRGRPHRRLGQHDPDHHGRLLPQRRGDRPQGQGRRGGRGGRPGGPAGRQGAGLAAFPRPVLVQDAHGGGPGLLRRRGPRGLQGRRSSRRSRCRPRRRCS